MSVQKTAISSIYKDMGISEEVYCYGEKMLEKLDARFRRIDETAEYNQLKVVKAMQDSFVIEAAVFQQIHLAIGNAILFQGAFGITDSDYFLQSIIGFAYYR